MKKTISRNAGIACILTASAINGLLPFMVTTIYANGGHFTNIMFYKGIVLVPVILVYCKLRGISIHVSTKQNLACALIALFQSATSWLLYGSYELIPTGMATTLHFMYPAAVMVIGVILFRDRPAPLELGSLLFCVVAVVLFSNSVSEDFNGMGVLVALLSAVVYAGYLIAIDKSAAATVPSLLFTFYVFLYNGLFSGIVALAAGTFQPLTTVGWAVAIVSAFAAGVVAVAFQRGLPATGSRIGSVLCVAEPLVSVLVGVLFLQEVFTVKTALGTACVVTAVVLAALFKKAPKPMDLSRKHESDTGAGL